MRRRSLKNSHPERNESFRDAYMGSHFYDELLPYFPCNGCGMALVPGYDKALPQHGTDAVEAHHSWGGRKGRWDKAWNLIAVCRPVHEFVERHKTDGRVLGLRLKIDQGIWDEADAFRSLGMYPLGWLSGVVCAHSFAEAIRQELVRQSAAGEI